MTTATAPLTPDGICRRLSTPTVGRELHVVATFNPCHALTSEDVRLCDEPGYCPAS